MEADYFCSDDELDRALDIAAGRGKGRGRGAGRGEINRGSGGKHSKQQRVRVRTAVTVAADILPTIGPSFAQSFHRIGVAVQEESHKRGGLRFIGVGILRGCFGAEDMDISATCTKETSLSAMMSERSVLSHQVVVMDGILTDQSSHMATQLQPWPIPSDILVVKRIWDEASIILRVTREILCT